MAWERKFLGFSFTIHRQPKCRIAPQALVRLNGRIRELTRRTRGVSMERMAEELSRYLRDWLGYLRRRCCEALRTRPAADFGGRFGSSGNGAECGLTNSADGEWGQGQ